MKNINLKFLILGICILFVSTISVSAAIMLAANQVSFLSSKTSQTTVQGSLDELYEIVDEIDKTSKSDCPKGSICTTCSSAGTFADNANKTCSTCSVGTYSLGNVSKCTSCPSGYTSTAGAKSQSECYVQTTAGKYIATAKSGTQTSCPAGYYCPSTKINYGNTGGSVQCPKNTYSTGGASSCTSCPSGYESSAGSSSCKRSTYTYTKTGLNGFTGTYTCTNGKATITSCSYSGTYGSAVCDGGYNNVSATYMCVHDNSKFENDYGSILYYYCNNGITQTILSGTIYGGGLPETESCS